jgi:hypothetical protein
MDQGTTYKAQILKLLEENIRRTLKEIFIGNTFLNRTAIAQEIRARTEKMGLHQIKKLLNIKGHNYQNQRTAHRMREIFVK